MNMDEKTFRQLVKQMRDAQKEYFKTRSKESLMNSKTLEKQVDTELSTDNNPTLF